jgi:hypothetical protein
MSDAALSACLRLSDDGRRAIHPNGRSWDCYFVNADGALTFAGLSCALVLAEKWLAGVRFD